MDNSHNNNILDSNGLKPFWNCWIFWAIDLTNMHWVILGRRQLRPNIFLSRAEGGHAKLGDFGLSTQLAGPWEGWMTMGTSFAKGLRSFLWLRQGEFLGNFGEIFPVFCSFPPKRRLETNILFVFWLTFFSWTQIDLWLKLRCGSVWLYDFTWHWSFDRRLTLLQLKLPLRSWRPRPEVIGRINPPEWPGANNERHIDMKTIRGTPKLTEIAPENGCFGILPCLTFGILHPIFRCC